MWTYITVGAWEANENNPFEYLMVCDCASSRYIELLTIVAWYGRAHNLGFGHTMPIGEPLVDGASCEHIYLSLPYTFGPELEVVPLATGRQHHILWVFPITPAEKEHLLEYGVDALEERFEEVAVQYWAPRRSSVIWRRRATA